jgi:antirestriction protein ArdC
MSRNLYQEVTDSIVAELKLGAAPWVKPWRETAGNNRPANAVTGRPYNGVNIVALWSAMQTRGRKTPRFLTFKQAKDAGGTVRRGEKGTLICFAKTVSAEDREDPEESRQYWILKGFTVFNVAQCDGLPARIATPVIATPRISERDALVDEFIECTGADIRENADGDAYYSAKADSIDMPALRSFTSRDHYYATVFHELGHWTRHPSRLDRKLERSDEAAQAVEELVAELVSAFICAEFNINGDLRHAGYIDHWLELLQHDSRMIFAASARAQEAADYLRRLALADTDSNARDRRSADSWLANTERSNVEL